MAMNKLGHPEGERNPAKAAMKKGIIFTLSTFATANFKDIADASENKGNNWF